MTIGLILLPLAGAVLTYLMPGRGKVWAGLILAAATWIWTLAVASEFWSHGEQLIPLGNWPTPLGIQLYLDGLSMLMLLMLSSIGILLSIYAAFYFGQRENSHETTLLFWPLWLFLWASLNGLFLASDVFTIYILLEIGLLAAVALATLGGTRTATIAGLRYLLAAMAGSLAYLLGVAILYNLHGTLDLFSLATAVQAGSPAGGALFLMTVGLLVKAALFPLHFWLPPAHASAHAPVSAILSALVIKGAFFVLLRLWVEFSEGAITYAAGQLLGGLAVAAIVWGSIQALRQKRLKMLIAYSTVAQVGFFFLLFPSLAPASTNEMTTARAEAWAGGAVQATAHALAKASLFLSAGIVILARGSDDLDRMRGLVFKMPFIILALLVAGLALYGIPASGSDLGKKMIVNAALADGQWWWQPFVIAGGFLTLGYTVMMLRFSVLPDRDQLTFRPVPVWVQMIPLALATLSITLAWPRETLLDLLQTDAPMIEPAAKFEAGTEEIDMITDGPERNL